VGRRERKAGRWGIAIAATVIVHALLLGPLLLEHGPPPPAPPPPMELALERPREPEHPKPKMERPASAEQTVAPARPATSPAPTAEPVQSAEAAPPAASGSAGASASTAGPSAGPALNLVCLGNLKRLSADQRRDCEAKQWAHVGRHDPSDSGKVPDALIDPVKAAHYQSVLDAKHSDGHPPGLGCVGHFGNGKGVKWEKPPHSVKLGPLPCYLTPPQGFLTPEADVPALNDDDSVKYDDRSPAFNGRPRF
jgi:hypothetical protein